MVIYREVSFRDLFDILVDSAKTTGGIMLIVASASLFSFVCTKFGIAEAASGLLASIAHNQFVFLLIVNIIFLIAGCFIDANSAMYIFIPIMLPVCKALGYDVVAFGVMATVNLAIGQVTPPVGVNLFVAISIKIKKGLEVTLQQHFRRLLQKMVLIRENSLHLIQEVLLPKMREMEVIPLIQLKITATLTGRK